MMQSIQDFDSREIPKNLLKKIAYLAGGCFGQSIVLIDICSFPRIANPNISHCTSGKISIIVEHIFRQLALLLLVLVLQTKTY